MRRSIYATILAVLAISACRGDVPAGAPNPPPPSASSAPPLSPASTGPVRLSLQSVSARRMSSGDVLFECEATLINTTGAPITTLTNFSSVFDGISIVIHNDRGDLIHEQSYLYHQSPYAEDQPVVLPAGPTPKRIVFPISDWDAGAGVLRVHLKGGLLGTIYKDGITSNERSVHITD